jgi:hypothetical protein
VTFDWVKDQDQVTKTPSIADLDEESLIDTLHESAKREVIREAAKENAETSPGKLTGEKKWDKWKPGLENQLSMLVKYSWPNDIQKDRTPDHAVCKPQLFAI